MTDYMKTMTTHSVLWPEWLTSCHTSHIDSCISGSILRATEMEIKNGWKAPVSHNTEAVNSYSLLLITSPVLSCD